GAPYPQPASQHETSIVQLHLRARAEPGGVRGTILQAEERGGDRVAAHTHPQIIGARSPETPNKPGVLTLKIHEYQANEILRRYGIPVQPGQIATTPEQAEAIAREFGQPVVIKAQVYVGGRGKAGGIQFGDTPEEARAAAGRVLGMDIKGLRVEKVLVTPKLDIAEEYYAGIVLDRASQAPVVMVSAAGGMDIEQVAEETPEKIIKEPLDVRWGLPPMRARDLLARAGVPSVVV